MCHKASDRITKEALPLERPGLLGGSISMLETLGQSIPSRKIKGWHPRGPSPAD